MILKRKRDFYKISSFLLWFSVHSFIFIVCSLKIIKHTGACFSKWSKTLEKYVTYHGYVFSSKIQKRFNNRVFNQPLATFCNIVTFEQQWLAIMTFLGRPKKQKYISICQCVLDRSNGNSTPHFVSDRQGRSVYRFFFRSRVPHFVVSNFTRP